MKLGGSLTAGTIVQVMLQGIMWMLAEATVDSGTALEDGTDVGGVQAYGTGGTGYFSRGVSLDYGTVGQLVRAFLSPITVKSAQAAAHS